MRTMPWAPRPMPVPWTRLCLAAGVVATPPLMIAWASAATGLLAVLAALDVSASCAVVVSLGRCVLALHRGAWRPALGEAGMAVLMAVAAASPLAWLALIGWSDGD